LLSRPQLFGSWPQLGGLVLIIGVYFMYTRHMNRYALLAVYW
jgi:hypothetical protein